MSQARPVTSCRTGGCHRRRSVTRSCAFSRRAYPDVISGNVNELQTGEHVTELTPHLDANTTDEASWHRSLSPLRSKYTGEWPLSLASNIFGVETDIKGLVIYPGIRLACSCMLLYIILHHRHTPILEKRLLISSMDTANVAFLTYPGRLQTFKGYWDRHEATARQLAAIGHVYDRPPLEVFEEGSRCISCSAFVKRHLSVRALEGSGNDTGTYEDGFESFDFHHASCARLQVRIPLDPQAVIPGLHGSRMQDLRRRFETAKATNVLATIQRVSQKSSLFSLPAEIRVQIYSMVLPSLDCDTEVVQLNRDSARVITVQGYQKTAPRNTTKLNIIRACKALHDETLDMIYSNTTFNFESTKVMYLFLRSIGAAGRRLIKSIDIRCGGREDAMAFALLAVCERLRSICIRLPRPMLFLPRAPIWSVDGMTCLLMLSGLKDVTFASDPSPPPNYLNDDKPDAVVVRKQLTRPRGSHMDMAIVESCMNADYPRAAT